MRDLVRIESRNLFDTGGGTGSSFTARFRNRLEFLVALNREKITDDGARYLLADAWRFEAVYMWTRSRNTIEEDFKTSENIIDIRVKRVF